MSRLSILVVVVLGALLLAGCRPPTATPTVPPTSAPSTGVPPTGYPADLPTATPPGDGYPAESPSATPAGQGYPGEADLSATVPARTATPAPTETPGPVIIVYRDFEIVPASTTIKAGTEVTFQIEGTAHQPYAGSAAPFIFEAPANLVNTTWSHTFNDVGTLTILCGYHANMVAELIVEP